MVATTSELILYVIKDCPFCKKARKTLKTYNIDFVKKLVPEKQKDIYKRKHKHETFPQLVLIDEDGKHILGGSEAVDDLVKRLG